MKTFSTNLVEGDFVQVAHFVEPHVSDGSARKHNLVERGVPPCGEGDVLREGYFWMDSINYLSQGSLFTCSDKRASSSRNCPRTRPPRCFLSKNGEEPRPPKYEILSCSVSRRNKFKVIDLGRILEQIHTDVLGRVAVLEVVLASRISRHGTATRRSLHPGFGRGHRGTTRS